MCASRVALGGGGVADIMHGRGRMTVDPRFPICNAGMDCTSGFHGPGRHLLAPIAKRNVRCWAGEWREGWAASH